jgi:hypothetical protein
MFNKNGFITLGKDIFVYKNFVTDQECEVLVKEAISVPEDKWRQNFNENGQGNARSMIWTDELIPIHEKIKSILEEEVYLGLDRGLVKMEQGTIGPIHSDNHDSLHIRDANKMVKENEDFDLGENTIAGMILYFNDFDGGDLLYLDQGITYHPEKGDLVIHSAEEHCIHQVQELKSGIRYFHSNNLFQYMPVPKGFNNVP